MDVRNVALATDFPHFNREIVVVDLDVRMTCMYGSNNNKNPSGVSDPVETLVVLKNVVGTKNENKPNNKLK